MCELAVMVVRSRDGSVASFPVVQVGLATALLVQCVVLHRFCIPACLTANLPSVWVRMDVALHPATPTLPHPPLHPPRPGQTIHKDSICWTTETPARVPLAAQRRAQEVAEQAISALEGEGGW